MSRFSRWKKFINDPHCYWCGIETTWETPADGILSNTAATEDHVISRIYRTGYTKVVLSCYFCNQKRARDEHLAMPYAVKYERSTRPPKKGNDVK